MDFLTIAENRQSCRNFQKGKPVEKDKLFAILEAGRLSPSACNGQPYHITVCEGEVAEKVAKETQGMGMNKFASDAPIHLVLSEEPYTKSAALGAKLKDNDYRSIDVGILSAYLTAEATAQGLATCILGWFDERAIRTVCKLSGKVRLVIALGYAKEEDPLRKKTRKSMEELVTMMEETEA